LLGQFADEESFVLGGPGDGLAEIPFVGDRIDDDAGPAPIGIVGLDWVGDGRIDPRNGRQDAQSVRDAGGGVGADFDGVFGGAGGGVDEFLWGAVGLDLAMVHDHDAVADALDFWEDVGADEHGLIFCQITDHRARFTDLGGVEPVGGFIEDQDGRVMDQGPGKSDALFVALGEMPNAAAGDMVDVAHVHGPVDGGFDGLGFDPKELGAVLEITPDGHFWIDGGLLWEVADLGFGAGWMLGNVVSCDGYGS